MRTFSAQEQEVNLGQLLKENGSGTPEPPHRQLAGRGVGEGPVPDLLREREEVRGNNTL